jgi:hypothetical protein
MECAFTGHQIASSASRSIVGVSGLRHRPELVDVLWADATDRDIVFVESTARAYSRIKQLLPDLVVLLIGTDDEAACQLLTMLGTDGDTSRIPVVIWMSVRDDDACDDFIAEMNRESLSHVAACQMH